MKNQQIELLAPAGSLQIGLAAIDAGADAVYIGGQLFSARAAAGNSIQDIGALCEYAHKFGAKVYLALNTLLIDNEELEAAHKLALDAIEVGIDAIIFQDVRLLEKNLPIEMHASTQTFNFSADRVIEMQKAGCSRVVLERALSIDEIRQIASATSVELEVFVHGAICVSMSGVCNLSEHLTGRSGNRGQCAQPCRARYDLVDADSQVIIANEALLSPRDLNLSARVAQLVQAGVKSLKIEGRLKEIGYVQNVVAQYDTILRQLNIPRTSKGVVKHNFTPDLRLSFNRGFTEWFFDGSASKIKRSAASALPPGEPIGKVVAKDDRMIVVKLKPNISISNGDGLCFSKAGSIKGVRVNRAEGNKLFLLSTDAIAIGTELYRNSSVAFQPSSVRRIMIDIVVDNQSITAIDQDLRRAQIAMPNGVEMASNKVRAVEVLKSGLSKSGGTIFLVNSVEVLCDEVPFLTSAVINGLRRQLLENMEVEVSKREKISYNKTCGQGLENQKPDYLIKSRYCILGEYGMCQKNSNLSTQLKFPLSLKNNDQLIALKFDCANCQMYLLPR